MNNEFVEKINNDINASNDEIIYLNGQKQLAKEQLPEEEYLKETSNIDKYIESEQEKIAANEEILKNYELAYYLTKNLYDLNQLYASERDFQTRDEIKEEIDAKTIELESARASLSDEAKESLDNFIKEEPVPTEEAALPEEPASTEESAFLEEPVSVETPITFKSNLGASGLEKNRMNNLAVLNGMIADYNGLEEKYQRQNEELIKKIFSREDISSEEKENLFEKENLILRNEKVYAQWHRENEIRKKIRSEAKIMLNPHVFDINDREDYKKIYDYFNQINLHPIEDEYFSNIEKQIYEEVISENERLRGIIHIFSEKEAEFGNGSENNDGFDDESEVKPKIDPRDLYERIDKLFHKATYELDAAALLEAEKLIAKISDETIKKEYDVNYHLVFEFVVLEKARQIWDLLDESEKAFEEKDTKKYDEFLEKANDICNQLPECDDKYHIAEEIKRIRSLGNVKFDPENVEKTYKEIEKLLLEATYNVTFNPLIIAGKLISGLPNDEVKQEYIGMYERTFMYVMQIKIDKITQLLEEAEKAYKTGDKENYKKLLDEGVAIINTLPETDEKNDLQAEAARIGSLGKKAKDIDIPTDIQKKPGKSLKTLAAVLAGIGIGVAVAFYTNPLGILVMNVTGVLAKVGLNSARRKAIAKGFKTSKDVLEAEPPREGLAGKIDKLKAYLKSEEGIRDMIWMVNAAMISGNVFSILQQFGIMPRNISPTSQIAGTPAPTQTTPTPAEASINSTYSNMPNQVFNTAAQAQSGIGAEMPIQGAFENFEIGRVFTPDGRNILIDGNLTPSQFRSTYGVDIADCTLGIQNPNGVDLSWNTANSLRK